MKKSIKIAILIPILAALILGFTAQIVAVSTLSSNTTRSLSTQLIEQTVTSYANQFSALNETSYGALTTIVAVVKERMGLKDERDTLINIFKHAVESTDSIFGLWTCWEPNAFDGDDASYINAPLHDATGRFVPYVYQGGSEALEDYTDPVAGDYYLGALNSGKTYTTEPFYYEVGGKKTLLYSIAVPILVNGKAVGVVGADINLEILNSIMNQATFIQEGYITVLSPKGTIATNPKREIILDPYNTHWLGAFSKEFDNIVKNGGGFNRVSYSDVLKDTIVLHATGIKIGNFDQNWIVCGIVPQDLVEEPTTTLKFLIILIAVVLVILVAATVIVVVGKKLRPLKELELVAKRMTQGDLAVSIQSNSNDELGMLTQSFAALRDIIFLLVNKINLMDSELAKGDIEAKIPEEEFNGEFRTVAKAINNAVGSLVRDTLSIMDGFSQFGKGDFSAKLPQYPGKKTIANQYFDELKGNLSSVSNEINDLIAAAIDGRLDKRSNADNYKGDWNRLIQGFNNLLQAVSTPIHEANEVLAQLSKGNFSISINKNYKGSFAEMSNSFEAMVTTVGSYINEITQALSTLAEGDLRVSLQREYVGQFNLIKESVNHIAHTLQLTMGDIKTSANNVFNGAQQISESAMNLATGATTQASSIEELNAFIININEKTAKTAEDAQSANEHSKQSMASAKEGNSEMEQMLASMQAIKEASNNISRIIKVIDEIAFQTNLLAINAAIEAARAGEQGKGFAVVAQEVRALASRSLESAKETSIVIEDSISVINDGMRTAQLTASSLQQIASDIKLVSDRIDSIFAATREQTEGISQIMTGINQISLVVQNNASTSEESAATAEELNCQAEILAKMVSKFTV